MISVIVPIYNVSQYLPQCLDSLCGQTYCDLDIILVNDGSTDGCYEICEEYRKKDSRIRVIHKENGGLVSARKAGIQVALGQYIAYVDGDDWIEPNMYERMHQVITQQKADVVMCGRYEDTGEVHKQVFHGIPEGRYDKQALQDRVYPGMIVNNAFFEWGIFPSVWDKLFRRECVERFQLAVDESITMGEDAACVYPCLLNVESIYIMRECLYHYRQTTASMVKQVQDSVVERKRFQVLYQSVMTELNKYKGIYDLRNQWREYVLFLMVPRADSLYKGYESLDYLFPFPKVKRGTDIVLYGAGTYGQRLFGFLERTGFCHVIAWVDRNYAELQKMGLPVESPDVLRDRLYDQIVVGITYAKARTALYQSLLEKYTEDKISLIDEELILSDDTTRMFDLC